MITGWVAIRAVIALGIFAVIVVCALKSSKPYTESTDVFGDWPAMTPLDVEWISKNQKRTCDCQREPRGA